MAPELHILRDLLAGQTTADSLAPRVNLSTEKATALLVTLKREGKVESTPLGGCAHVHVFRLTQAGRDSMKTGN